MVKIFFGCFIKKNFKKQIKQSLGWKEFEKDKLTTFLLSAKIMIIHLTVERL